MRMEFQLSVLCLAPEVLFKDGSPRKWAIVKLEGTFERTGVLFCGSCLSYRYLSRMEGPEKRLGS